MDKIIKQIKASLSNIEDVKSFGLVSAVSGMLIEVDGLDDVSIGKQCIVHTKNNQDLPAEVVGFKQGYALLMPFGNLDGVGRGCRVDLSLKETVLYPSDKWLGRIVDGLGNPIDGKGALIQGSIAQPAKATAPLASDRQRMGRKMDVGIRALNNFLTICEGQRMGIFAGSGVGKSIMMSMLARNTDCDIAVIGLIGERGREVKEFIEDDLGAEGLKRSIVIVATSDQPALVRRQAAFTTMAVAEYFRSQGKSVLCMMDSLTRFAMAQREIGLSAGEPPTSKGYPPTAFSELAKLLERAGPGLQDEGNITALFTVLVEGDDHNEPVSDTVRGIIDGHIVLDRAIAQRGRYPAIDILKSVSRALPRCNTDEENILLKKARSYLATYEDMAELIRLGAYKKGSDAKVDLAIEMNTPLEEFLSQTPHEVTSMNDGYDILRQIIDSKQG